jgi:YVTN family beta-propeller protein
MAVALLSGTFLGLKRAWAGSVIENIHVGDTPTAVAYDWDNGCTYVTNADSNTVSVIDGSTNTVIDTISVGE